MYDMLNTCNIKNWIQFIATKSTCTNGKCTKYAFTKSIKIDILEFVVN